MASLGTILNEINVLLNGVSLHVIEHKHLGYQYYTLICRPNSLEEHLAI
jgi:hypothetical protein